MALAQRSAGRFFAAFYEWNRFAHTVPYKSLNASHHSKRLSKRLPVRPPCSRPFVTSRPLQHNGELVEQMKEEGRKEGRRAILRNDDILQKGIAEGRGPQSTGSIENGDLSDSLRMIMRRVGLPIVVLTAAAFNKKGAPQPVGMAISSFNTVTLHPPTISFNIRDPSRTLSAIREDGGRFLVHLLGSTNKSAAIADAFTRGNDSSALKHRNQILDMELGSGPAKIRNDGVTAWMECKISNEFAVADHIIVAAEVLNIEHNHQDSSDNLLYVNGNYIKRGNTLSKEIDQASSSSSRAEEIAPAASRATDTWQGAESSHILYSLHPFPTQADRDTFEARLRTHIEQHEQKYLTKTLEDAEYILLGDLSLSPNPLGINVKRVISSVADHLYGKESKLGSAADGPVQYEFYGTISKEEVATIIERVKAFVRKDPLFLSLPYRRLFALLKIDPRNFTGLTAGDILTALRGEGLAKVFVPTFPFGGLTEIQKPTLEDLERVEHIARANLLEIQKQQGDQVLLSIILHDVVTGALLRPWIRSHLRIVRPRLLIDVAPALYSGKNIDLAGHLPKPHVQVAIARIFAFLWNDQRARISLPTIEILRLCRIHPLVTGFDADLLVRRMIHYSKLIPSREDFRNRMRNEVMGTMFKGGASEQVLAKKASELVRTYPIEAVTWSAQDQLAAMGIAPSGRLRTSQNLILATSRALPQFIRQACEEHRAGFTAEERAAVDRYMATKIDEKLQLPIKFNAVRGGPSGGGAYDTVSCEHNLEEAEATHELEESTLDSASELEQTLKSAKPQNPRKDESIFPWL